MPLLFAMQRACPVIFPQLEFANKINDMVSTAGTVKWAICEYTVTHLQFGFEFFVFIYLFFCCLYFNLSFCVCFCFVVVAVVLLL